VQLPFLQVQLHKPFKIVPIVLGTQEPYVCRQLAKDLKKYFVPGNLFVISSDFSHYPDYETAVEVDKHTADAIMSNNPDKLIKAVKDVKKRHNQNLLTGLCGWTSVLTLMYMTEGDKDIEYKHLGYMNSGDTPYYGDKNRVVGYNAIAVVKKCSDSDFTLTEEQKKNQWNSDTKQKCSMFQPPHLHRVQTTPIFVKKPSWKLNFILKYFDAAMNDKSR
jgi:hypothetical protein